MLRQLKNLFFTAKDGVGLTEHASVRNQIYQVSSHNYDAVHARRIFV